MFGCVERARMINRVDVEDQPRRPAREAALDCAIEQPRPDAPSDALHGDG